MKKHISVYVKIIIGVTMLILTTSIPISADNDIPNGTIIGEIYATDIVAYIDDIPIESYNIGGRTAVVVEDLADYGFKVFWYDEIRQVDVTTITDYTNDGIVKNIDKTNVQSGTPIGNIYSTDIVTIINGVKVPSYNIGGRTAIILEDIGVEEITSQLSRMSPPDNIIAPGYTRAGFHTVWDAETRTIKAYVARHITGTVSTDFGEVEIFDVINEKGSDLYYGGISQTYEVENPENEYSAIHSIEYGATIENITISYTTEDDVVTSRVEFFYLAQLLGYMGVEYKLENGILDITMTDNQEGNNIPLTILSYNLYNSLYMKSPLYSTNIKIAVNGKIVVTADDMYTVVVDQSNNGYYLYINLEALETALGVKIFIDIT